MLQLQVRSRMVIVTYVEVNIVTNNPNCNLYLFTLLDADVTSTTADCLGLSEALAKIKRLCEVQVKHGGKKLLLMKAEINQQIVDDIRNCVQKYPNIYLFSVQNIGNNELKSELNMNGRFIFAENFIIRLSLGFFVCRKQIFKYVTQMPTVRRLFQKTI